jgi:hypothetical protein
MRAGHAREFDMTNVTRIFAPPKLARATAETHPLVVIALFCAVGLLLSLSVLLLDQYLPGEWF